MNKLESLKEIFNIDLKFMINYLKENLILVAVLVLLGIVMMFNGQPTSVSNIDRLCDKELNVHNGQNLSREELAVEIREIGRESSELGMHYVLESFAPLAELGHRIIDKLTRS